MTIISTETLTPVHVQHFSSPIPLYVLISEENNISVFINFSDNSIKVYNWSSNVPIAEMSLKLSFIRDFLLSSDGKYLFLQYKNESSDIFNVQDLSRVTRLYDISSGFERFFYVPELDSYVLSRFMDNTWLLLNQNLEIYSKITNCIGFSGDTKRFIINTDKKICAIPYYDYDTLVKKADEVLKKYECSEATKIKYNIK